MSLRSNQFSQESCEYDFSNNNNNNNSNKKKKKKKRRVNGMGLFEGFRRLGFELSKRFGNCKPMNIYYASLSGRALIHTITSFIHISSTQKVFLGHLWMRSFDIITENDSFIIDKSPIEVDSIFFSLKQAYFSIIMHFRFLRFYS